MEAKRNNVITPCQKKQNEVKRAWEKERPNLANVELD
jgi:hypothetical protein